MENKNKLINKISCLLKKANVPPYLHRFGPRKLQTKQLCLGLLVKEVFRLSYRRTARFLSEFYNINLHWTTLQKFRQRMPLALWQQLLAATNTHPIDVAAIDGTALQRSNPSQHYLKRIDGTARMSIPVYVHAMVDVIRRKFVAVRHHARKASEVADVRYLVTHAKQDIELILMDKAYDSEHLHRYLRDSGIYSVVPVKKNWSRGQYRKQLKECFDYTLYWQRNLVESLFSAVKRLFGAHLHGRTARTQRAEVYMRMIAYNLGVIVAEIFY